MQISWESVVTNAFNYSFISTLVFSADDDGDVESVSNDMMLALHQSNETLVNVAAHLENLETLMRLLCHVSFIHHKNFHLFYLDMYV